MNIMRKAREAGLRSAALALALMGASSIATAKDAQAEYFVNPSANLESPVKVRFEEPDQFADASDRGHLGRASESVMKNLARGFEQAAVPALEEGQTLEITVTDIDLAGEYERVHYAGADFVRVYRQVTWPTIAFSYQVLEAGAELASGKAEVRDMNYLQHLTVRVQANTKPLPYEKAMLEKWFAREFGKGAQQPSAKIPTRRRPDRSGLRQS